MISEEYRGARKWSRNRQAVAIVVWISFLSAAIGTMVFFALFDPVDLSGIFRPDLHFSRDAGYAVGFFFFWVLTTACSGVTAWLVRTAPKRDRKRKQQNA
ncbi:MAG: hypothetical protein AAGE85_03075 [Pseudomonadota bacterium]